MKTDGPYSALERVSQGLMVVNSLAENQISLGCPLQTVMALQEKVDSASKLSNLAKDLTGARSLGSPCSGKVG